MNDPGSALRTEAPTTGRRRRTMRTAVLAGPGRFELREVAVPDPDAGHVRVRVEGCGVCGSDLAVWRGAPWFEYPRRPGAPGHEAWGVVDAVGPGVTAPREGERVACLGTTGFAEFTVVEARETTPLPDALGAVPFPGEPLACAVNIWERSGVKKGDDVAVVGVGFLGALLVELAVAAGARVVALSRRETSLRAASERGAQATFALEREGAVEAARATTGDRGFDVVVEAAGHQSTLDAATALTSIRGRLVVAGYHQNGSRNVDMQLWNWRGIDVVNAHEREPAAYMSGMRRAVRLYRDGILDPLPLFTHEIELARIESAFALLEERPAGFVKALVRP